MLVLREGRPKGVADKQGGGRAEQGRGRDMYRDVLNGKRRI